MTLGDFSEQTDAYKRSPLLARFQLSALTLEYGTGCKMEMCIGGNQMKPLTIGQVARQAGVGVETVRFYEREGLIEEPDRRASGYRQFEEVVVDRLRFIHESLDTKGRH